MIQRGNVLSAAAVLAGVLTATAQEAFVHQRDGMNETNCASVKSAETSLVEAIDPMIGAIALTGYGGHGLGKCFPGATRPFGMCQLSPDTITGGDNGPGYSYHHETIEGFSFFHMSGIGWYGDLGNFQVMPADAKSRYSHKRETAKAGYYSVFLDDPQVTAELTVAERGGIIRFTYPENPASVLKIDLARRIGELRRVKHFSRQRLDFLSDTEFTGLIVCDHRDGGWGRGAGGVDYTVYFHGLSSKPLVNRVVTGGDTGLVVRATFPTTKGEQVMLHVDFSYVGVPARPEGLDFDAMRRAAHAAWAEAVGDGGPASRFEITGGTRSQRRSFATALYHAMLDPRKIDGMDLGGGFRLNRTCFSGWDVFRSEMPFLALVAPETVRETIESMMAVMESGRRDTLPVWDLFGCPSSCMLGNPLIPTMLTAADCGIPFDLAKATRLAEETMRRRGNGDRGWVAANLSATLEYCYDYWCAARLAERAGDRAAMARMDAHSRDYTNCWDASVGWMRARDGKTGGWLEWKGRTRHGQGCTESNPYQQGWFVPHDVCGFVDLIGGREKFLAELVPFFEKAPKDFLWGDYYNHPNEPSHHIAYLFPYAGRPDLTQKWTRRILANAYSDTVKGLCGNDDVGQMSAWYVLSALGIHPVCPGSGVWIITSPIFERARVRLGRRRPGGPEPVLTVVAKGAADPANVYIRSARLNGRPLDRAYVTTAELLAGATLEYELGPEPNAELFARLPVK